MKADARQSPPGLQALSDADLAYMAQSALTWNHSLPPGAVRASVAAGWLTLSGEVRWHYQRQDAANCVRDLPGIVGVSDCITLKRPPASE
jgi:osmotically-inducible protein OsmY